MEAFPDLLVEWNQEAPISSVYSAKTGKVHWTYDMFAQAWGSPLIVDGKVYIGDEDGEVCVFQLKPEQHEPLSVVDMGNSVFSTPIVASGVLYIANQTHLFAICTDGK